MNKSSNIISSVIAVAVILSLTITNCGSNDTPDLNDNSDGASSSTKEYIKVDGVIYDQIDVQTVGESSGFSDRNLYTRVMYDFGEVSLYIVHEKTKFDGGDSIVPGRYVPSYAALEKNGDDQNGVSMTYIKEFGNSCEYNTREDDLYESNGSYELLKIDSKYVSEFSDVTLYCEDKGTSVVVEGYIIWEDK